MSKYSAEERQRILRESHQTLQRVDRVLAGASHHDLEPPAEDLLIEALSQPLEDRVAKWKREADLQSARFARFERERRRQESRPAPANLDLKIASAIADERGFLFEVLAETIAELADRQTRAIEDAVRPLEIEIAQLKVANGELKVINAELRLQLSGADHGGKTIDALALRSRAN